LTHIAVKQTALLYYLFTGASDGIPVKVTSFTLPVLQSLVTVGKATPYGVSKVFFVKTTYVVLLSSHAPGFAEFTAEATGNLLPLPASANALALRSANALNPFATVLQVSTPASTPFGLSTFII